MNIVEGVGHLPDADPIVVRGVATRVAMRQVAEAMRGRGHDLVALVSSMVPLGTGNMRDVGLHSESEDEADRERNLLEQ